MVVDTPQERAIANKKKVCLMSPGRASCKDLLEVITDISQEPLCEHTGEQIDDGLAPRVTKEILEAIKDIRQERISEGTGARQVDVLIPQVMEERVEVPRSISRYRIQRCTAEEMMDVLVPETQEQIVDAPAPQIVKETIEVARSIPLECSQHTVEQVVDVSVPQLQERIVQVGKEQPCERMGAERGNHVHQSSLFASAQGSRSTTVLCQASRKRSLRKSRTFASSVFSELRKVLLAILLRKVEQGQGCLSARCDADLRCCAVFLTR